MKLTTPDGPAYRATLKAFCERYNIDRMTRGDRCWVRTCNREYTGTMLIGVDVCTRHGDAIEADQLACIKDLLVTKLSAAVRNSGDNPWIASKLNDVLRRNGDPAINEATVVRVMKTLSPEERSQLL